MNASAQTVGTTPRPAAAYRQLLMRGLAPDEAANITALMRGIPIGVTPWTVREISHLLFLRAMHDAGRFGPDEGV
jgi:outer membrane receptor for Fe3+-dicitrate